MEQKFSTYACFLLFVNKKELNEELLRHAIDFICLNLRRNYDSLKWNAFYTYSTYCEIALRFKKENNLPLTVKIGDTVCKKELVNFLEDEKHKRPHCNCGSTYMQFDPLKKKIY